MYDLAELLVEAKAQGSGLAEQVVVNELLQSQTRHVAWGSRDVSEKCGAWEEYRGDAWSEEGHGTWQGRCVGNRDDRGIGKSVE